MYVWPKIQLRELRSVELVVNSVFESRINLLSNSAIAADGKLKSEQKMKISNLCRKIGSGTSQMAVLYPFQCRRHFAKKSHNVAAV